MRSNTPQTSQSRAARRRLVVAIAILLLAAGSAQAIGSCTTATIDEPYRLPDGLLRAGGKLTLCLERNYSPVAALHEIRVDGMGVGLFLSRRETSEGLPDDATGPYMLFRRLAGGELSLVGLATPLRDRMQLHFLDDGTRRTTERRTTLIARANDPTLVVAPARTF